jgi:integrase
VPKTRGFTVKTVENLQAREARYELPDHGCAGLYIQVHPSGAKSWCFRYRFDGKSRKLTIGAAYTDKGIEVIKIGDARNIADEARVSVAKRIDPIATEMARRKQAALEAAAAKDTFKAVAAKYLKQKERLRTIGQVEKTFERLVYPEFGDRHVEAIKRSEIVKLLDNIAKTRGPAMADSLLASMRRVLNWHSLRSDDYVSPIRRGMARTSTKERSRKRTLSRIELQSFWHACEETGLFGQYLRFVLLTATRRSEAAQLPRAEIAGNEWTIPGARYKTKLDHLVPMSERAVAVLAGVSKIGRGKFVFTADGMKPITGFGPRKKAFDCAMLMHLQRLAVEAGEDPSAVELKRWTIHDLRRTARTLFSEAGVLSEHAELCLGHVKGGVEATYDRHSYRDEKRAAFEKLAALIDSIVGVNIIPFFTGSLKAC